MKDAFSGAVAWAQGEINALLNLLNSVAARIAQLTGGANRAQTAANETAPAAAGAGNVGPYQEPIGPNKPATGTKGASGMAGLGFRGLSGGMAYVGFMFPADATAPTIAGGIVKRAAALLGSTKAGST